MHYGQSIYLPVPILVEPILVSAAVSRHASDGNNLAPKPPPPTILIVGNASKVISLFNTRAPITKPVSGSIVASAIPNSPFTYKSGGEVYPLPVFNIVNESMIHLTSLSFATVSYTHLTLPTNREV